MNGRAVLFVTALLASLSGLAHPSGRCEVRYPDPAALSAVMADRPQILAKASGASGPVTIDILVAYDKSGAVFASRFAGDVDAFAHQCIDKMNSCLVNTELDRHFAFRLAGTVALEETETTVIDALDQMINTYGEVVARGEWRKITSARESMGADIVSLLVDDGAGDFGVVGHGYSMPVRCRKDPSSFADWAYNVCNIRTVTEDYTMLHEVGHNMGCGHPDASCASGSAMSLGPQLFDYSSGYYTWSGGRGYYTIMGYNFGGLQPGGFYDPSCIFEPLPCFSSPDYTYGGMAIGTPYNDNTKTLVNTCIGVSQFRKSKAPDPGPSPSPEPVADVEISCGGIEDAVLMVGVSLPGQGFPVTCNAEVKKLSAKGLPSGIALVQDRATRAYALQGTPRKAFDGSVTLTATLMTGKSVVKAFDLSVLPASEKTVGNYTGVVADMMGIRRGTITIASKGTGKLTAKVITASATYSFSANGWSSVELGKDGGYVLGLEVSTRKGDVLQIALDTAAPWNEWCMTGEFRPGGQAEGLVMAQRNAYVRNGKIPADEGAAAFLAKVLAHDKGKFGFDVVKADGDSWSLTEAVSAKPALTITVDRKGMAKIKGSVGDVRLSGSAQLIFRDERSASVEFVLPVKRGAVKSIVDLFANLWFGGTPEPGAEDPFGWVSIE